MEYFNKEGKGFTLIELMVVVAVIGVLTAISVPQVSFLLQRGRDAVRAGGLRSADVALAAYFDKYGSYAGSGGAWRGGTPYNYWGPNCDYDGANGYIPNLAPEFIKRLPEDPTVGKANPMVGGSINNGFIYWSDGINYKLLAHCGPESHYGDDSWSFYDPIRPTWAWATYSAGGRNW